MEQQESIFVRNARIIGVAGVAAGVVGGVAGRLLQGQREPTRQERLQLALADLTGKDMSSLRDLVGDASATVKDDARRALAESKSSRGAAWKRGRKAKAAGLSFTDHMRDALRQGAEQVGETLQGAIDETSRSLSHYAEEVSAGTAAAAESSKTKRDKAKKRADKTRSEVEARAREGRKEIMKFRQDASGKAKDARSKAEDRLHVLEDLARETVEKKVKPSLEKATASAAVGATEARKRIGEEAKHIEHLYAEAKPKVQESVEHYGARATEVGSELRHTAAERAHEAEKALQG